MGDTTMKAAYLVLIATAFLNSSFAGDNTQVTQPPPICGTGWYFGLGGGANVHQDYGDSKDRTINGDLFHLDTDNKVGGFGGIKFGYVFGSGAWRWGLEEDWFYNGVNARAFLDRNGVQVADADAALNTGAFMTNLLLRYAPNGGCGFQPYILGGVGGWWGETGGNIDVTVGNTRVSAGSRDNGGFAFQLGVGADYYFSPKWSIYTEYKFLDYTNAGNQFTDSNVGQHLVGAGFRIHF